MPARRATSKTSNRSQPLWAWLPTDPALLETLTLPALPRQPSLFQLWRNLKAGLAASAAAVARLRAVIRAVWDAPSERATVVALVMLARQDHADPLARPLEEFIRTTFQEATLHRKALVAGLPRTTGVVEGVWRRSKRRIGLMQCLMSEAGADHVLVLDELSMNFHRSRVRRERKRRYPDAGQCPLEIAGARVDGEVGGRRLVTSWLDALAISAGWGDVSGGVAGPRHRRAPAVFTAAEGPATQSESIRTPRLQPHTEARGLLGCCKYATLLVRVESDDTY